MPGRFTLPEQMASSGSPTGWHIPWGGQKRLDELHIAVTEKEEDEEA